MENIEQEMHKLSWHQPENIQKEAIEYIVSHISNCELPLLVLPEDQDTWHNAAIIIQTLGYPRIKPIIKSLFIWLQDMNWPGADMIEELLLNLPENELADTFPQVVYESIFAKDEMWIYWLYYFNKKLKEIRHITILGEFYENILSLVVRILSEES